MKFAGHETFHIRNGWLKQGLLLANKEGEKGIFADNAADLAGVGANMIKSIRHWLAATQLTSKTSKSSNKKIVLHDIAKIIERYDPNLQSPATWWALHINLVKNPDYAFAWNWFFNDFGTPRFEKAYCTESLHRFLNYSPSHRTPAKSTLDRDISVLLASYSQSLPREAGTPEDTKDCPFQQLGLITYSRESAFYSAEYGAKNIPSAILAYSIRSIYEDIDDTPYISYSIPDLIASRSGPGRTLLLRGEELYDLALKAEAELGEEWVRVTGMAGSRLIQIRNIDASEWIKMALEKEQTKITSWEKELKNTLKNVV